MNQQIFTFPMLLKKIRKESGITQQELADSLGLSKVLIGKLESGMKEPSKKFINLLAAKLEVHPATLMPFLAIEENINFNNLSFIERSLINSGIKLQKLLITKKSKLLSNA